MTQKEKSDELIKLHSAWSDEYAAQHALITVYEIIEAMKFDWMEQQNLDREYAYWNGVKEEILKKI